MEIVRVSSARLDFPIIMERTVERFAKRFRNGRIPRIEVVYLGTRDGSSGMAWPSIGRIRIRVGSDMQDAEHVLLHELTHLISDRSHGKLFYRNFKKVIKWAGVDPVYSEDRERRYKPRNSMAMMTRRSNNESTGTTGTA